MNSNVISSVGRSTNHSELPSHRDLTAAALVVIMAWIFFCYISNIGRALSEVIFHAGFCNMCDGSLKLQLVSACSMDLTSGSQDLTSQGSSHKSEGEEIAPRLTPGGWVTPQRLLLVRRFSYMGSSAKAIRALSMLSGRGPTGRRLLYPTSHVYKKLYMSSEQDKDLKTSIRSMYIPVSIFQRSIEIAIARLTSILSFSS